MVGKIVTGKTYDPKTFEVSISPVRGKVLDSGTVSIKFWPNGSKNFLVSPVDVLFCSPILPDGQIDTTKIVNIPFYLLSRIENTQFPTSSTNFISGPSTRFLSTNREDFLEGDIKKGLAIVKAKCPVVFWETGFSQRNSGASDFLICYPVVGELPTVLDFNDLIFLEESKCVFSSQIIPPQTTGIQYYYQNFPPTANEGDIWFHSNTGISYVYVDDGTSLQWVQPF